MNNRGKYKKVAAEKLWRPRKAEIEWLYYNQMWSIAKIAAYYKASQTGLGKMMKRLGIQSQGRARLGKHNGRYKDGSQSTLYRQMIVKDKCEKCEATERLVIHHRNGDHQDNHLRNLQVLCESCHNSHTKRLWWAAQKSSALQTRPTE